MFCHINKDLKTLQKRLMFINLPLYQSLQNSHSHSLLEVGFQYHSRIAFVSFFHLNKTKKSVVIVIFLYT